MKSPLPFHDAHAEPALEAANRALGWQTPAEKRLFDAKLATDPGLALEVRRMEDILANLSGSAPVTHAPESALDKALRRVRDHHREPSARPVAGRWIGWAVAACFAASSAWLAFRPNNVSVVLQPPPTQQTPTKSKPANTPRIQEPIMADSQPSATPVLDSPAPTPNTSKEKFPNNRVARTPRDFNANPRRVLSVHPLAGGSSQSNKPNPNENLLAANTGGSGRVVVFEIASPVESSNLPQFQRELSPTPLANHVADVIADAVSMELPPPLAASVAIDPQVSTNRVAAPNLVETPPIVADVPAPISVESPHAFAVFNESNGQGTIVATDVQPLPEGQTYQLWVKDASMPEPISAGIIPELPGGSGRVSVQLDSSIEISDIFLTIEPAGGSSFPGNQVVLKKQ